MSSLAAWMDRAHETDETLAAKVGVSRVQISRIRRRVCEPSLAVAASLEAITGIPAASFAKQPPHLKQVAG